jgi:two-component system, chemotaxis family, chemotaxis protein CheY
MLNLSSEVMPRVLLVDDSRVTRRLLGSVLKSDGYAVDEAENGIEALEKLGASDSDLIIADLNMPNMDGMTFVRSVRETPCVRAIPIVMLTVSSDRLLRKEAMAAGADVFMTKPIKPARLLATVKSLLKEKP